MKHTKKLVLIGQIAALSMLLTNNARAQITLSQTTVNNYVATICGTGVTFSNVSLTGDTRAIATFLGGLSAGLETSMNSGVVMSTGMVNTANALQGSPGVFLSGNNNGPTIPELDGIAGDDTYDGIILEFDFVPITNAINVNYVFGSEEYNEWVNAGYNDAFAFLISGPGIAGSPNIAVLPGNIPVTIDNINLGSNSSLYRNNISLNNPNVMDGYTVQLTASQTVVPCQTYHIRLMIADGGDQIYDSWVFIQENGLFAVGDPPLSIVATYPFGTALYEECTTTNNIIFNIPQAQGSDYTFNVTWGGTATPGADFGALPTSITIPAGQTSVSIPVSIYTDGIAEGVETITCTYPMSVCEDGTATVNIDDPEPLTVDAGPPASLCSGASSASLNASSLNGNGTVTYAWDNGGGNTQSISVSPASTTTYTVTATDQCGLTATDQVTVTVGTPPAVDAGAPQSICAGQTVTLSGSGASSYFWDNGVSDGVPFSAVSTLTYTVTGTAVNGCQGTDQVTVTVNNLPTVDAGLPQSICSGGSVTLNGSGASSYSWNNGVSDGVSFSPGSTVTYTVTGTDANGCQNTDQVTITVNALPVVDAGVPQNVCTGGSVTLNGSGANSYSWDNGGVDGVAFVPASTTTYTVTGTDGNGCQNTDQVTVTVNNAPTVDAGAPQNVCTGGSVTLNGSGAVSYTWNNGVSNGIAFTPASTTTYTVTGTDGNGCQNTDQVTITVNNTPAVDAGLPQSICAGGSVTLSGSGAISYSWNNGVSNGVAFTPGITTTYTVTGTDGNGCQNSDQVTITVNTLPSVDAGAAQSVCSGGSVTLNGSGAVSYTWNNGVTNGAAFTPGSTTTYTVTGTDANGCQNTDQVMITVNTLPVINAGADQTVCEGTSVTLSGSGGVNYTWTNGVVNSNSFTPGLGTVTYTVTGTDANGCTNTDQVTVTVVSGPIAGINSTDALTGYPGMQVEFTNESQNATSYLVDFGNGQTGSSTNLSDTYWGTFSSPGTYVVTLTASNGICTDTDQMQVIVNPYAPLVIHLPNVFTPDGDGTNDAFYIDVENGATIQVIVVNRWDNVMFEINDFITKWDGTFGGNQANEGTYFYKYTITGLDGTTQSGHQFVELLRK
jgi:gliding motility-associated-like protein